MRRTFLWDCLVLPEKMFLISCLGNKMQVFWGEGRGGVRSRNGRNLSPAIWYFNKSLFSSSYLYFVHCSQIESTPFQFLQRINLHFPTKAGLCALSCWLSMCESGEGNQPFPYMDFHPIFHFVLPLHPLTSSKI